MLNRVILIGRLAADPNMRYTQTGTAVTNFTIAVERPFTNQDGKREADFIDIVVWRKTAEFCADYCRKGNRIAVEGRLQKRSYDTDNGRRWVVEVVADNVRIIDWPDKQEPKPEQSNKPETEDNGDVPF